MYKKIEEILNQLDEIDTIKLDSFNNFLPEENFDNKIYEILFNYSSNNNALFFSNEKNQIIIFKKIF